MSFQKNLLKEENFKAKENLEYKEINNLLAKRNNNINISN